MMNVGMRSFYPIDVFREARPLPLTPRMRPLLALPFALLIAPATADAAQVMTDRGCYYQTPQTTVSLTGSGFTPGSPYSVALDGKALGGAGQPVREDGTISGGFQPASLPGEEYERTSTVAVTSDALAASTTFTLTRLFATFSPARGVPSKLKVRFSVYGFGLDGSRPDVYVHYVAPRTRAPKAARTVRLGRSYGQCGSISRTAKRRLFPFTVTRYGRWRLQFDANRTYRPGISGSGRSSFAFYTLGVCVRPPNAKPLRPGQPCPTYR
jgi:hypothetical protein